MLENTNLYYGKMENFTYSILNNNKKKKYFAINTDCYNIAMKDKDYRNIILDKRNQIYVDGAGIQIGQKITKAQVAEERIATTDLFIDLLKKSNNHSFYLLGGKPGTAKKVIDNLSQIYPNAKFVGFYHGYFDKNSPENIIQDINKKKPDTLLIGFGCPNQEKWVTKYFNDINAINFITCGGLFDYYSNNVKRAPKWMQKSGLEWFFRFLQEPSRLFKRYFIGNTKFILKIFNKKVNGKYI